MTSWRRALLVAAVAAAAAACNRPSSEGRVEGGPPLVELRDTRGQRRLAVWKTGGGFRWVDSLEGSGQLQAEAGGRLRGHDPRRGLVEATGAGGGTIQVRYPDGTALRLSREGDLLRLGDAAGIPIARVRSEKEEAVLRDAGGVVALRARRAGGRIVVTDREGATVAFVVGNAPLEQAAFAALSSLSAVERVLLLGLPGP
jgi:hypothetical protein